MSLENYIKSASRTDLKEERYEILPHGGFDVEDVKLLHAVIGLVTETGELADAFKKHIFYRKDIDWINILEETGDLMWYLGILFRVIEEKTGTKPEGVLIRNIEKLKARYPNGFKEEDALNRDLSLEKQILDGGDNG